MIELHGPGLIVLTTIILILAVLLIIGIYYERKNTKEEAKWELADEERLDGNIVYRYRKRKGRADASNRGNRSST